MKRQNLTGTLCLIGATLIWGAAIVAQSVGNNFMEPFTFNTVRFAVAAVASGTVARFSGRFSAPGSGRENKMLLLGGLLIGIALFISISLQQFALLTVPVGKAIFITSLYVITVPMLSLCLGAKVRSLFWGAVGIALTGLYLICSVSGGGISVGRGEFLLFLCSCTYTAQILLTDFYAPKVDCVRLTGIQFAVVAVLSAVSMVFFEHPQGHKILQGWMPLLYTGVLSSSVAYALQAYGQRLIAPGLSSLILSMEAAFGTLAGWLLLGETMTGRELVGCGLMFVAIAVAQCPSKSGAN